MNLLLVRVDDRFIHGQILESWIPYLKAQSVVVVNDILAGDHFQKTIMSMAIPDRITLRIVSLDEVACLAQDSELDDKRTPPHRGVNKGRTRAARQGAALLQAQPGQ